MKRDWKVSDDRRCYNKIRAIKNEKNNEYIKGEVFWREAQKSTKLCRGIPFVEKKREEYNGKGRYYEEIIKIKIVGTIPPKRKNVESCREGGWPGHAAVQLGHNQ